MIPKSTIDHALSLYERGYSYKRAGAETGIARDTVRKHAIRQGIARTRSGRLMQVEEPEPPDTRTMLYDFLDRRESEVGHVQAIEEAMLKWTNVNAGHFSATGLEVRAAA